MTYRIKTSIVRIRDVDGGAAGAGFLVGDRCVLTCAHVVNLALGRSAKAVDRPPDPVSIDFPLLAGAAAPQPAAVLRWLPETGRGDGDVALLQLAADPPAEAAPVTLVQADEPWGHRFRVCGFPAGYDGGDWASGRLLEAQATRWLQMEDDKATGHWVQPGYSGAPVWDEQLSGIVGMTVAADRHLDAKVAYVLPTAVLIEACPELADRSIRACPYRGLAAFREADADLFFGREAFTARLVDAVRSKALVALVGASGSGKSSVLFAGLLPALAREGDHVVAAFRPGRDPFHAVAAALLPALDPKLTTTDRLLETPKLAAVLRQGRLDEVIDQVSAAQQCRPVLLLGDQFEELFTLCPDIDAQRSLLDVILRAVITSAAIRQRPLTVLLALRADFYDDALQHRPFADALQDTAVLLGPMTHDELRRAVEEPARARGVIFEAGLVDRILDEVEQERGYLPLLEFTLTLLWEKQVAGRLTHRAYEQLGGVEGALAGYADGVLDDLPETERGRVRRVFVQLVKPGDAGADARRLANRAELDPADWTLLQRLADQRLVVTDLDPTGRETAEVVHEALIQRWPRLRSWMTEDRDFRVWQERLRDAVHVWQVSDRDSGGLLRGAPLAEAERWLHQRPGDLGPTEQDFIHTSRAFQGRTVRRLRALATGLALLLMAAVATTGLAWQKNQQLQAQTRLALSRQLAGEADQLAYTQPDSAILAGLQSLSLARGQRPEPPAGLITGLARRTHSSRLVVGHAGPVYQVAFGPDGKLLATAGGDGTVRLWDVATGQPHGQPLINHTGAVEVAFNPNGKLLATASQDGTIRLWDVATGQPHGQPLAGHTFPVYGVAFSRDGKLLATASSDRTIRLWDVATGQPYGHPVSGLMGQASGVAISPDAKLLAAASQDGTIRLWDVATGQPHGQPLTQDTGTGPMAFSPDGKLLATGSSDMTVRLWDVATGQPHGQPLAGHTFPVYGVAFSPDGKLLASSGQDMTVRLWDVATGQPHGQPLAGHTGIVYGVTFSPDGKLLASAAGDGMVRVWEVAETYSISQPLIGHAGIVFGVAFSPDGKLLASASQDATVRLWDVATGQPHGQPLTGHTGVVFGVAFSPDGKLLATAGQDGTVRLWDVATGQPHGQPLTGHTGVVYGVAFSPDGKLLATAGQDGTVRLWDVATGQPHGQPLTGHAGWVYRVAFSPDGKLLASASQDATVRLWDVATGQPHGEPLTARTGIVFGVAFSSPDGRLLATAGGDGSVRLWDVATRQPHGQPLTGNAAAVNGVAFSPDGKLLATAGQDATVRLWDVATGQPHGEPLTGHTGVVFGVAFSPDGKLLATASQDATVRLWQPNFSSWLQFGCKLVNRNLSVAEWNRLIPDYPYERTCPDLPAGQGAPSDAPVARY